MRSLANTIDPIFQYGKDGLSDNYIAQIESALEARELIKITLLENASENAKEVAERICEIVHCQSVQIIGRKIVLYKQAREKDKRKIKLPK